MKKQKYSVEFSHIYADEPFADKQLASVTFLNDLVKTWDVSYSTIILIDNYNVDQVSLKVDVLLKHLGELNIMPDFWAYESDLVAYASDFSKTIEVPKIKHQYQRYYSTHQKYPCSFLTAIWYSIRLGILDSSKFIKSTGSRNFKPADRLVNVLDDDFREIEHKTLKLLKATSHKEVVSYIQNFYYETAAEVARYKGLHKPIDV